MSEIKNFENNVATVTKAVYLGDKPLSDNDAEIAYHFKSHNRLVSCPSGQKWEFLQIENVRNDLCVMIGHEAAVQKYRELINKEA